MKSIDNLTTSPSYTKTVEKIVATGLLEGEQAVEIFDCFGGYLVRTFAVAARRTEEYDG